MKILILRSQRQAVGSVPTDAYTQTFGGAYAERVLENLRGADDFCKACGPDCIACRKPYDRRFDENVAGVIAFPAVMPYVLENPADYVPRSVPAHDVLLAINIHEQLLIEAVRKSPQWHTRAIVAPIEAPDWVRPGTRAQARALARDSGVETAFPKPFCAFDPPAGTVLAQFRKHFHIGKPEVTLDVKDGRIDGAHVEVSAACGATYYVARWLTGKRLDDDLKYDVVSKRLHSYPCTASMDMDDELGDTILHVAGQAHFEILAPLEKEMPKSRPMVMSPLGRMVPQPVPVSENARNIEAAKEAILADLARGYPVRLKDLKCRRDLTPAAIQTALIILKQEQRLTAKGDSIFGT